MKTTTPSLICALFVAVSGCVNHPNPNQSSSSNKPGAVIGNVVSVVRNSDVSGVEQIEAWKVDAETIAAGAGEEAKADYLRFKGMVDAWVNRKKKEVNAAAMSSVSRKADLSRGSISSQLTQSWQKLGGSVGTKGTAVVLLGIAVKINEIIVKGKEGQARLVNEQLDELRLKDWPAR